MKKNLTLIGICLCLLPLVSQAQYRWRDADGKVGFGDEPPRGASAIERIDLQSAPAAQNLENLPYALRTAVQRFPVTLYTTDPCSGCSQVRAMLTRRGIPFTEKTVSTQEEVELLKRQGLGERLPVITVGKQVLRQFRSSDLTLELSAAGYPEVSVLPPGWKNKVPQPLFERKQTPPAPR